MVPGPEAGHTGRHRAGRAVSFSSVLIPGGYLLEDLKSPGDYVKTERRKLTVLVNRDTFTCFSFVLFLSPPPDGVEGVHLVEGVSCPDEGCR